MLNKDRFSKRNEIKMNWTKLVLCCFQDYIRGNMEKCINICIIKKRPRWLKSTNGAKINPANESIMNTSALPENTPHWLLESINGGPTARTKLTMGFGGDVTIILWTAFVPIALCYSFWLFGVQNRVYSVKVGLILISK